MPMVCFHQLFKPFIQDQLPQMTQGAKLILAHPGGNVFVPAPGGLPVILVIGPEGGLVPFEISLLESLGFKPTRFGERILRTDAFLPFCIARIFA